MKLQSKDCVVVGQSNDFILTTKRYIGTIPTKTNGLLGSSGPPTTLT